MGTRERILSLANRGMPVTTQNICKNLQISRQTVADHLRRLVHSGILEKHGSTRGAYYHLARNPKRQKKQLSLLKVRRGLEEDRVFLEIDSKLSLKGALSKKAYAILSYAFTEMLNNAIDHSRSKKIEMRFEVKQGRVHFKVRDWGIGIFRNVKNQFKLRNELEAVEHVFKGKQTTLPSRHSGEGIFFTSRIADQFSLRSHRCVASIDNELNDTFLKEDRYFKGTDVDFRIHLHTKKSLELLFRQFANEEYEFDRNVVRLKLSLFEGFLSRSQAKRLLMGLDKFKRITIDFNGVKEIGQAFADEIFRIFATCHPGIELDHQNASPAVSFMIRRAKHRS